MKTVVQKVAEPRSVCGWSLGCRGLQPLARQLSSPGPAGATHRVWPSYTQVPEGASPAWCGWWLDWSRTRTYPGLWPEPLCIGSGHSYRLLSSTEAPTPHAGTPTIVCYSKLLSGRGDVAGKG